MLIRFFKSIVVTELGFGRLLTSQKKTKNKKYAQGNTTRLCYWNTLLYVYSLPQSLAKVGFYLMTFSTNLKIFKK